MADPTSPPAPPATKPEPPGHYREPSLADVQRVLKQANAEERQRNEEIERASRGPVQWLPRF